MLVLRMSRSVARSEHSLGGVKKFLRDEWLMEASMPLAFPHEISVVDRVVQRTVNLRLGELPS